MDRYQALLEVTLEKEIKEYNKALTTRIRFEYARNRILKGLKFLGITFLSATFILMVGFAVSKNEPWLLVSIFLLVWVGIFFLLHVSINQKVIEANQEVIFTILNMNQTKQELWQRELMICHGFKYEQPE